MSGRQSAAVAAALRAVQRGMLPRDAAAKHGVSVRQLQRARSAAGLPAVQLGRKKQKHPF